MPVLNGKNEYNNEMLRKNILDKKLMLLNWCYSNQTKHKLYCHLHTNMHHRIK